jgi:hypothetical protein
MTNSPDDPLHGSGDAQGQGFFNSGLYVGEGTFNGPVAVGYQARAVQFNQAGSGDDLARLEDLLQQLEGGIRQLGALPRKLRLPMSAASATSWTRIRSTRRGSAISCSASPPSSHRSVECWS